MLIDGGDVQLRVVEGMLLPCDRHAILHTEDSSIGMAEKICQNLAFVSNSFPLLFVLCTCCFGKKTFVAFCSGNDYGLWPPGKSQA